MEKKAQRVDAPRSEVPKADVPEVQEADAHRSKNRVKCPACLAVFRRQLAQQAGKEMTCPGCKKRLVVCAVGGRTVLELADVDGRARTTLYRQKKESPKVEEVLPVLEEVSESEDPPAKSRLIWLVLPATALVFSLMFCLVASVVRFWPRGEDSAANTTTPAVA